MKTSRATRGYFKLDGGILLFGSLLFNEDSIRSESRGFSGKCCCECNSCQGNACNCGCEKHCGCNACNCGCEKHCGCDRHCGCDHNCGFQKCCECNCCPHPFPIPRPECACVPIPTTDNNGQVLTVVDGEYQLVTPAIDNGPLTNADYNFQAYNFNLREIAPTGMQAVSETIYFSRIHVTRPITVFSMFVGIASAGVGLTAGQSLAGIYDASGNLLAETADQSAAWTTAGPYGMPIAETYLNVGTYWLAVMSNGTTPPWFAASQAGAAALNFLLSGSNLAFGTLDGQTTLPATFDPSALMTPAVGTLMPFIALG